MSTSTDLLDAYLIARNLSSDRQAMLALKLSPGTGSHWRQGRGHAGPEAIAAMCKAVGRDEQEAQARIAFERAQSADERAVWRRMLERIGYAAAICLAVYTSIPPAFGSAGTTLHKVDVLYITYIRGRLARFLIRLDLARFTSQGA